MPLAKSPCALYDNADPEVILTVLLHKINKAAEAEGLAEARGLLQDWLVTLTARYNQRVAKRLKPDQTLDVSVVLGCTASSPLRRSPGGHTVLHKAVQHG